MKTIVSGLVIFFTASLLFSQVAVPSASSYIAGFSPGGSSLEVVVQSIRLAKNELLVACYEFTSKEIARELIAAKRRGVAVSVVADQKEAYSRASTIPLLVNAGIPVYTDAQYAIMHNKTICIDRQSLELGSFNYTEAAVKRNAENALLLKDLPQLAQQYVAEWERLKAESTPYGRM